MFSRTHDLGLRPNGDLYLLDDSCQVEAHRRRITGLGSLSILDDEALLHLVLGSGFLVPKDFARLAQCSKTLAAFSLHDDLYRANVLKEFGSDCLQSFRGDWRRTYIARHGCKVSTIESKPLSSICKGVYSDLLFQSWACYASPIPKKWWVKAAGSQDTLSRRDADSFSMEDFINNFEKPNIPVVITGCVSKWKAYKEWTFDSLRAKNGATRFHVAGFDMLLSNYLDYLRNGACDADQPLYLFDKDFAMKGPDLVSDYDVPIYFANDLFSLLSKHSFTEEMAKVSNGSSRDKQTTRTTVASDTINKPITIQDVHRPDYRWLIIGPKKSGSVFHKDPNATSAWNACIRGKKKWILFPPHMTPPGVFPSEDGGAVETPVSVMEWFLNFYKRAQSIMHHSGRRNAGKEQQVASEKDDAKIDKTSLLPIEGVVNEGELIYVPRGWWHCVLNLEDSIAITQNFCSAQGLPEVLKCLKEAPHTISGVPEAHAPFLYEAFREQLKKHEPGILEQAEGKNISEEGEHKVQETKKLFFHEKFEKDSSSSSQFVLSSLWE